MTTFKELPEELQPLSGIAFALEQEADKLQREGAEAGGVKHVAARLREFMDARQRLRQHLGLLDVTLGGPQAFCLLLRVGPRIARNASAAGPPLAVGALFAPT
jgi:hypothetical protein